MKILANQQNIILDKSLKMLEGHIVPKTSCSYDYQKIADNSEITRELYQFKNAVGKIVKEVENVIKGNVLKEVKVTAYETRKDADIKRVFVKDAKTGNISYTKEETFPMEQGKMSYIEKVERGNADEHKIKFVSEGIQDKEISYKTNWDGKKPKIKYKNIKGKLPKEGLEYLPLIVSEGSTKRINHIAQTQINQHSNIVGIAKLPIIVSFEFLNKGKSYSQIKNSGLPGRAGQARFDTVQIVNRIKTNEKILSILSHEYQHSADHIGLTQANFTKNLYILLKYIRTKCGIDSFKNLSFRDKKDAFLRLKSMKNGIFLPHTSKSSEYKKLGFNIRLFKRRYNPEEVDYSTYQYKNPLEVRAFDKSRKELGKFYNMLLSIKDLLTQK